MVRELYSEYDTDITIRPKEGKVFNEQRLPVSEMMEMEGIVAVSRAIEEVVILKHEKKRVNATLIGVDSVFLQMTGMQRHMVDGGPVLEDGENSFGIIGATLLDKLGGFIPSNVGHESVLCYVPKRKIKIRFGSNPFRSEIVKVSGRMNFNREVNAEHFVVPLSLAKSMLGYKHQISALYIDVSPDYSNENIKEKLIERLGEDFVVKTNYEKNELIYKTSKSEKLIVLVILLFIFILAAFNLVASLTMLFVEKVSDIKTMESFGANRQFIFRIFFYEGLLIAGKGILFGAMLGYLICCLQMNFNLLVMPNSGGEPFPISISFTDSVLILGLVSLLSIFFSYFPVKYLIYKNLQ